MQTILEEAEDNMKEAISKEGKKICDPNQVGNYGSDPISRKKNQELLPTNSNPKIMFKWTRYERVFVCWAIVRILNNG